VKPNINDVAIKLRDKLRDSINDFEGLYVFGSQVKGQTKDDSDVDIVLIFKQHYSFLPDTFYQILSQITGDYYDSFFLDVLDYTKDELKKNILIHNAVVNKGVYYGV